MGNDQTDSVTAVNDLLERYNQLSAEVGRLRDRVKVLEERAEREDMAKSLSQLPHLEE